MRKLPVIVFVVLLRFVIAIQASEQSMSVVTTPTGDIELPTQVVQRFPLFRLQRKSASDRQGSFVCHLQKKLLLSAINHTDAHSRVTVNSQQTIKQSLKLLVALDYLLVQPSRLIRLARDLAISIQENCDKITEKESQILSQIAPDQAAGLIAKGFIGAHSLRNDTLELDLLDLGTYRGLELIPTIAQLDLSGVRSLDLSGNLFTQLAPKSILLLKGLLPHLEYFDLSDNMIRQIPAEEIMAVCQVFPRMKRLKLNGNHIERLTSAAAQKLQGLSLELKRTPLKELPFETLCALENIHLFIADTPLARNVLFNPQNARGFSLVGAEFQADESRIQKTLRLLRTGKTGRDCARTIMCVTLVAIEAAAYCLGSPTYYLFALGSLVCFIGYEYLICTVVIHILPTVERYGQVEVHTPLDSLIKMIYPNYLEPVYPVTISHI